MCRLAGFIDPDLTQTDLIRMRDSMIHGGPDDAGMYIDTDYHIFFGHRRLSIIDLSEGGHQPKSNPTSTVHLVYNGEIYNYKDLRKELMSLGKSFQTQSDTEVILHAYDQWGTDCFSRLNGMFTLAIWDQRRKKMILARDHAGIKPLYYSVQGDRLYFASEVKAFKALKPNWPVRKDWKVYFLAFGHLPEPVTTLEEVQPLPKASYMEYDLPSHTFSTHTYYSYYHRLNSSITPKEAEEHVKYHLNNAVRRHLISDAPIGLFLSGGIDSSLLTLLAQPELGDHLKTLSIYFNEEKYSEKKYQDIIIQKTKAHHQSFLVTQSEFDESLPDVLHAMDQPSTDAINSYFISKYAHEYGLKAVLSGLGADELFGGYPSILQSRNQQVLKALPSYCLSWAENLNSDKFRKISFLAQKNKIGEYLFYRGLHSVQQIAHFTGSYESEVIQSLNQLDTSNWNGEDRKEKASYLDFHFYMQNQLLKDSDFMSMWHSLEIRVPFLDKELLSLVLALPSAIRFDDHQPKKLLIQSFVDILPESIWNRPKQGFTFPLSQWLLNNELAKPQSQTEEEKFNLFQKGNLSWSRYWSVVLCNRYSA